MYGRPLPPPAPPPPLPTMTRHKPGLPLAAPVLRSWAVTPVHSNPMQGKLFPFARCEHGGQGPKSSNWAAWGQGQETLKYSLGPLGAAQPHDPNRLQVSRITTFTDGRTGSESEVVA